MSLPNNAHVRLNGLSFDLDEDYEHIVGRRPYSHGGRSLFAEQFNISGIPGARNLRQEDMVIALTNFDGEGQVSYDNSDEDSYRLFYRSEGINTRVQGQFSLLKSAISQTLPLAGPSATTYQGNADFTDITGTSTTSGTDRKLTASGDIVGTTANFAPGAGNCVADFYLFSDGFATTATTIAGSSWKIAQGDGAVSGSDLRIRGNSTGRTDGLEGGVDLFAGAPARVEFYLHSAEERTLSQAIQVMVMDTTGSNQNIVTQRVVYGDAIDTTDNPSTPVAALTFTPTSAHTYQFRVYNTGGSPAILVDSAKYGREPSPSLATVTVYNQTGSVALATKTVSVSSSAAGAKVASIPFTSAAATNYRFRVTRTGSQPQGLWVDKVIATDSSGTAWTFDALEVGLGGRVFAAGHASGSETAVWRYDPTDDTWEDASNVVGAFALLTGTSNETVRALAHNDTLEYVLLPTAVWTVDDTGADAQHTEFSGNSRDLVGMCIAQNRVMLLAEDDEGYAIYSVPLDPASVPPYDLNTAAFDANCRALYVAAGEKVPDTTLRARMCSTPTGARYFVNYGDSTCKVYEVDGSGANLVERELADLGHGVIGKAIAYENGLTFVTVEYVAETDQAAQNAIIYIDANGVPERLGFFREDDPLGEPVIDIEPYQTDIYFLQSGFIYRYSTRFGGLTQEYALATESTTGDPRALAVTQGRIFALYENEVWVTGTEDTYRQSAEGTNPVSTNVYISSLMDYGLPGVQKALTKIKVLTFDFAAWGPDSQVTISYQVNQDGEWHQAGIANTGSETEFTIPGAVFDVLQVRAIPESLTGSDTPYVRAIIITARAADNDEYFDLVLRTEDEDSSDHIDGQQVSGGTKAQQVVSLWRSGTPFTFDDGYASKDPGVFESYLVTIQDLRVEQSAVGEGRLVTTLKVVS